MLLWSLEVNQVHKSLLPDLTLSYQNPVNIFKITSSKIPSFRLYSSSDLIIDFLTLRKVFPYTLVDF
jgi:hypothetical protein